ncbi:MAG: type II secretion system F family protein [Planctomycetota bacterium]|jgi:type IV pilus assembly protein PilC
MLRDEEQTRGTAVRENPADRWSAASDMENLNAPRDGEYPSSPGSDKSKRSNLKIGQRDLVYFIGQLSIMFDTGLNLMTALECLAGQARNPAFKKLIIDIRHTISEGSPLWLAMKKHPRVFSPICVSMVRAGEASGNMEEMLRSLENYLERQEDIRTRVRSALSYPIFMLVASVGVLIFLLTYVFPKFETLFEGREDTLPTPTKIFLGLSDLFVDYWYFLLAGAVVVGAAVIWCLRHHQIRFRLDSALLSIPLLGTLLVRMSLSRSFHTLALMLDGGIPTLDAMAMAQDVSGNHVFSNTWRKVSIEAENGRDITGPLRDNPHVPPSEIQMISMGDRSGKLSNVLSKISLRYEKEIDLAVKGLIRFVEPALVIAMGLLVGLIVLSLILPIFALSRAPM